MNSSLFTCDRATHLKIVAIALVASIVVIAVGIHARNWICLAVCVIPPTLAVLYRIHVEEIALRGLFGDEYIAYSRTVKKLIPGLY